MEKAFKKLCELTAEMVDARKITNSALSGIVKRLTSESPYIFSKRKGHNDSHTDIKTHTPKEHTDNTTPESTGGEESSSFSCHINYTTPSRSEHTNAHLDYDEHRDYVESKHSDNNYAEGPHHTDSDKHSERSALKHTDG